MRIGVVFPQTELGADIGAIRAYAAAVEDLGYRHVLTFDHVVGADPAAYPEWSGPYNIDDTFHEPMVFHGFLAGITRLEQVTGIVILPQRQTVLAAKQAAEVDLLTEGRFRLGVGLGWNAVEYEALGKDFTDRGRRIGAQIALMRRLWTEPNVTHEGRYDTVRAAGIAPLPVQRPIPVWFGGSAPAAYRRMGRLADGWFPQVRPGPALDKARAIVHDAARAAGRDPDALGMEGRVSLGHHPGGSLADRVERVSAAVAAWADAGATHVSVNTMGAGLATVDDHIAALAAVAGAILN